jgi:predicted acylesterase/phospholipase RssA
MPSELSRDSIEAKIKPQKKAKQWWNARQTLRTQLDDPTLDDDAKCYVRQQLALCTYKDPELRRQASLDEAMRILIGDRHRPEDVDDSETAGIAGAICKRRWELDGRDEHLTQAVNYYRRSALIATSDDKYFYGAINAAFCLEMQASRRDDSTSPILSTEAQKFRDGVIERTNDEGWWSLASLLEAHLGNRDRDASVSTLGLIEASQYKPAPWEVESTVFQLARLMQITDADPGLQKRVFETLLPTSRAAARTFGRRFGLALSGGGFRASLFHLGVLAALAEHDLLRPIEVLSCVSGGSILGVAYYSALAELLERKLDADIGPADLVEVMETCIARFTTVVTGQNIRTRAYFGPRTWLRGRRTGRRTRSLRTGMLYEENIYQPLRPKGSFDQLDGLLVHPAGEKSDFRPKTGNLTRGTKVPTLVINATSLGTGRPWRFTATSMGEPDETDEATDSVTRLSPIWFDRTEDETSFGVPRVGDAVAASAGVPGLFPPVNLNGLYEGRRVSLVDGGVFDNQGTTALLAHDCTDVLISDASGLLAEKPRSRNGALSVLLRTNSVLMSANRTNTFATTAAANHSGQLRTSVNINLLTGVTAEEVPYIGGNATASTPDANDDWRRAVAQIRTDLDRFTPTECAALMHRGYHLTCDAIAKQDVPVTRTEHRWAFMDIDQILAKPDDRKVALAELQTGRKVLFKWVPFGRNVVR